MIRLLHFFEKIIKSDNSKCKRIQSYNVFSVLKAKAEAERRKNKKKKSPWNAFNLLPNEDYGEYEGQVYYHRAICMMAANHDINVFERLYKEVPESEVWDFLAIDSAVNYTPSS